MRTKFGEAQVDGISKVDGRIHASGKLAQKLLTNGMNINALRTNDTLRKEEWKTFDDAVIKAAQERLLGVADLHARGLTYDIPNGLGTTVLEYEDMSDMEDAEITMDAVSPAERDRVEFDINYLPLPICHKDFWLSARVLASSRTRGNPLDTTMAELAGRKVAEKLETILFQGASSYAFGGGTLRGYQDFPHRTTGSLTTHWDDSGATGETMLGDLLSMKQDSIDDRHYGPWMVYIPTNFEVNLDEDFKSASDKSSRQRLLEVAGIIDIKVADFLSADNVVLVQMTSNVVRMVTGLKITTVEWDTEGGMRHHFKVMAIDIPQLRADQDDRSGIVHYT